ncbi:carbon-nitrogen hydrolase family protein [Paraburkholderia megapolitana]|uniref:Nitrilase n=1 Tax=Paraburkholderia megapolitana TaxID=420953 RepID=A0A1I3SPY3_9BURK|nr:carbon-nitrogen hydrolase family protein [Paraburkholderia megapolitana]QDQ85603.1 carbon-nitrogen hydrolase family protein [Paraburkholderia megapolitana]SFJ60795.1 nitrilase [Paraburkholderia megapolitana]
MGKYQVAVVQAGSRVFDTAATLDRMEARCREAAQTGAQLIVFPEAYVGGYPKGLDFGARVGMRSAEGRNDFLRYWQSAIEVPGPEVARIGTFAKQAQAYLVAGVIERDGATLYCTMLYWGPDGALMDRHRKLMPTASERLVWGMGDGSTLPVLDTPLGRLGGAICWENYMPALRMTMYAKGIGIWCAPTVDDRDMWQSSMRHIAYEGRCFVLSACQYLTRDGCPPDYAGIAGDAPDTVLIRGGSVIVSPLGEVLAGPVYGKEAILSAEIDTDDIVRGKFDLDVTGHYARPDVFELKVDTRARSAVSIGGSQHAMNSTPAAAPAAGISSVRDEAAGADTSAGA